MTNSSHWWRPDTLSCTCGTTGLANRTAWRQHVMDVENLGSMREFYDLDD